MFPTTLLALLSASSPATADAVPSWTTDAEPELVLTQPSAYVPASPALADEDGVSFSYTFVEIGATTTDVDDFDGDDVDTYYGRGSLSLFKIFHVFAAYENQSTDFEDTDTDQITLGVGAHLGILPKLDVLGEVGWLFSDVSSDLDELDESDNGYEVFAGARWMPIGWNGGGLEVNGGVGYIDLDNLLASDDNPVYWQLGARLHFLQFLSVGASYTMIDEDDELGVNARFSF